jgi:hypothetical protein
MGEKCIFTCAAVLCCLSAAWGVEYAIDPSAVNATASSVNYQLEAIYSCNGNGLAGDLHTNNIGGEPPPPGQGTMWLSNAIGGQWIRYQFDDVYTLSSMWVWNYNQVTSSGGDRTERGIRDCTIEYSTDGAAWSQLGSVHTFARADGSNTYAHNTEIDFGLVQARHVRITVINNHGGSTTGLSEVRFFAGEDIAGVSFETDSSGNPEFVGAAALEVVLSETMESAVTVDFAPNGGTAVHGSDYTLLGGCYFDSDASGLVDYGDVGAFTANWLLQSFGAFGDVMSDGAVDFLDYAVLGAEWRLQDCGAGSVRFEPGSTHRTIYLDIIDDGAGNEDNETAVIALSNASGAQLLQPSTHTYTIFDAPSGVSFESETSWGLEDAGMARMPVSLTHPSTETVTVDFSVTGGTASGGGVDYMLTYTTVTFDPGQTAGSVDIRIRAENLIEDNETIIVTLSNPVNTSLGAITQHIFTIIDDDAGVWFDNSRWFNSETGNNMILTANAELEWQDIDGGEQIITTLQEQSLSQVGDVVELSYVWTSAGTYANCDCYVDQDPDPNGYSYCTDVTCVGGTGDFRVGLLDSNGQGHITDDNMGPDNPMFSGYLGYQFRIFPHVPQDAPSRFTEYKTGGGTESHTNTSIWEREDPFGNSALLSNSNSWQRIGQPMEGGFGIPVGGSAIVTMRLERINSSEVKISINCNGKTWTKYSESPDVIPAKIDTFAMWSNGGAYSFVRLGVP